MIAPNQLDDAAPIQSVVLLVGPHGTGKSALLAAVDHLAGRMIHRLGDHYELEPLRGLGRGQRIVRDAEKTLQTSQDKLMRGQSLLPSTTPHSYQTAVIGARGSMRRRVALLDTRGALVFPTVEITSQPLPKSRSLAERLRGLDCDLVERSIILFVNGPGPQWEPASHGLASLERYLGDLPFARVVIYVGCTDLLFPRVHDLDQVVGALNREPHDAAALERLIKELANGPQREFIRGVLRHLLERGQIQPDDERSVAVFWGSASGRRERDHLTRHTWSPVGVIEPVLWASGVLG